MPPQCIPSRQARITAGEFILQPVIQWAESPLFYRPSHCTIFGGSTVILYEQEQYFFLLSGIADD